MKAPTAPKVTWRAGADKLRHGHLPRATRTLCGLRIVDQVFAHEDARQRCGACLVKLDRLAL